MEEHENTQSLRSSWSGVIEEREQNGKKGIEKQKKIRRREGMQLHALPCAEIGDCDLSGQKILLFLPRYWKAGLQEAGTVWGRGSP